MANKNRIYIDSCCFIDIVKHQVKVELTPEQDNNVWFLKKLLEAHRDGSLIAHTSVLAVAECLAVEKGQIDVPEDVKNRFRALLTSGQFVHLLNPTPETTRLVQAFRWKHNLVLSGADAIHLASALERGCTEFITTDDRLKSSKVQKALEVLSSLGVRTIPASKTQELSAEARQLNVLDGDRSVIQ